MSTPALLLQTSFDSNADGTPDSLLFETYSAEGNLLKQVVDNNADGQIESATSYTYNANEEQTGLFFDNGNDGTVEYAFATDYAINDSGNLVVTSTSRNTASNSAETYISIFNSDGNPLLQAVGFNGNEPQTTNLYTYNNSGQITSFEVTGNGSPRSEGSISEYSYDEAGRFVSSSLFFSNDRDNPFRTESYTYSEAGNLIREETFVASANFRSVSTYTYDDQNRLIESTNSNSGVQFVRSLYTYNAVGQIVSYTTRTSSPGQLDSTLYTYEYDAAGNLIQESFDANNDGTLERIIQYGYDDLGRIASERFDSDADGVFERTTTYRYDDLLNSGVNLSTSIESDSTAVSAFVVTTGELSGSLGVSDLFLSANIIDSSSEDSSILASLESSSPFVIA